ncbi:MAG: ribosomal protein S18-alanine N-acetyltransferase [Gammaproteobacteria bacterium]|nr:ribosomal protein S18-alanine N-acetyltransferase [Gammaproteobacteria bacterium]
MDAPLEMFSDSQLRPMTAEDIEAVMAIELCAYEYPWSAGIFQDCLNVGYCCWVYKTEHALAGYAVMSVGAGEAHLLNLCVRTEWRRYGLGRRLLKHMLSIARGHHADTALLEVRPSNQAAISLYHAVGFNEVGMRKAYYPAANGKEDAIILALSLV